MSNQVFAMRRFLTVTLLTAAMASAAPALAQEEGGAADREQRANRASTDPTERVNRRIAFLTERLRLSNSQVTSVREILLRQDERIRASMQASGFGEGRERGEHPTPRRDGGPDPQFRAELEQIRSDTERELARVLSDDQLGEYRELEAERRPGMGRRGTRPDDAGRSDSHLRAN